MVSELFGSLVIGKEGGRGKEGGGMERGGREGGLLSYTANDKKLSHFQFQR